MSAPKQWKIEVVTEDLGEYRSTRAMVHGEGRTDRAPPLYTQTEENLSRNEFKSVAYALRELADRFEKYAGVMNLIGDWALSTTTIS